MKDYEGKLNFATDTWTSPNHKAYIAVTVHLEVKGAPLSMLLDIVEVAKVRQYHLPPSSICTQTPSSRTPGSILLPHLLMSCKNSALRTRYSGLRATMRALTT
jgi:hypothetical protein